MLRTYKHNGKLWRYEEGEQPAGAVEVSFGAPSVETPEKRAAKAPAKRRKALKAEAPADDAEGAGQGSVPPAKEASGKKARSK